MNEWDGILLKTSKVGDIKNVKAAILNQANLNAADYVLYY